MNQTITPAAIRKTLTVQATPEKAFEAERPSAQKTTMAALRAALEPQPA